MNQVYSKRQRLITFALLFAVVIVTLFACRRKEKFDKRKWAEVADLMTFPNRKYMIDDLVKNYHLKGKTYHQLVELLGSPQSQLDSTLHVYYDIDVDYGSDIDPIYTKIISFDFSKDSVVTNYEVQEWRR